MGGRNRQSRDVVHNAAEQSTVHHMTMRPGASSPMGLHEPDSVGPKTWLNRVRTQETADSSPCGAEQERRRSDEVRNIIVVLSVESMRLLRTVLMSYRLRVCGEL